MQAQLKPLDPIVKILRPAMLIELGVETLQACAAWVFVDLERKLIRGEPFDEILYHQISEGRSNLDSILAGFALLMLIPWVWLLIRACGNTGVLEPRIRFVRAWMLVVAFLVPPLFVYFLFALSCAVWRGSALKAERELFDDPNKIPVPWYFYFSLGLSIISFLFTMLVLYFDLSWSFSSQDEYVTLALFQAAEESLTVIDYAVALAVLTAMTQRHALRLQEYEVEQKLAGAESAPSV